MQALTGGDSQLSVESVILPDGEDFKTLDDVARVWDKVGHVTESGRLGVWAFR